MFLNRRPEVLKGREQLLRSSQKSHKPGPPLDIALGLSRKVTHTVNAYRNSSNLLRKQNSLYSPTSRLAEGRSSASPDIQINLATS